jgi:hypothetical protein
MIKLMQWVLVIPVFQRLIDVVDQRTLYLVLMNLFVLFSIIWAFILYFGNGIRIYPEKFGERIRESVLVIGLAIILLTWAFLFSNIFFYIRDNQASSIMTSIAQSPYCFGFFYCAFGAILFGLCFAVLAKAIVVAVRKSKKK